VQKFGDVRPRQAALSGKHAVGELTALDFAQQYGTKVLVHFGKVHLWNVHRQPTASMATVGCEEIDSVSFAFISRTRLLRHGAGMKEMRPDALTQKIRQPRVG